MRSTKASILYTGGRAIDTLLEGSQFHSDRHIGGFLPYPVRSLALSPSARDARPRLRRYDELEATMQPARIESRVRWKWRSVSGLAGDAAGTERVSSSEDQVR